jgi:hypothetical protein
MKIALQPPHLFWGLMNPKDLKLTLSLTDVSPISPEVNQEQLMPWEIKQILASVKAKRISISVQVEDLVKLIPAAEQKKAVEKKAPARGKKASALQ